MRPTSKAMSRVEDTEMKDISADLDELGSEQTTSSTTMDSRSNRHSTTASSHAISSGKEFQWINITNPQQSADRSTMRNVRAHVMNNYLQKGARRHSSAFRTQEGGADKSRKDSHSSPQTQDSGSYSSTFFVNDGPSFTSVPQLDGIESDDIHEDTLEHSEDPASEPQDDTEELPQSDALVQTSAVSWLAPWGLSDADMMSYDNPSPLWRGVPDRGMFSDPFESIPRFEDPRVDIESLRQNCTSLDLELCKGLTLLTGEGHSYFGNCTVKRRWFPVVTMTQRTFLSSLCTSAAYLDAMQQTRTEPSLHRSTERIRTRAVFEEVISLINKSLRNEETRTDDATIVTVLHLLSGELMMANDAVLDMHEQGLWAMVEIRGGLDQLGHEGRIAAILVITVFELSIFRESQPRPECMLYANDFISSRSPPASQAIHPESPLYMPFDNFSTLANSKACSTKSLEIIQHVKTMIDMVVQAHGVQHLGQVPLIGPMNHDMDTSTSQVRSASLNVVVYKIFDYPRDARESPIHEAIRLCARLCASAIWYNIPLSVAARPAKPEDKIQHVSCGVTPALMKQVLLKTDLYSCWDDMIGVLLWIGLVSAAACNTSAFVPAAEKAEDPCRSEYFADTGGGGGDGTRKWLIALAMRCSILLGFENTAAVMETLRKLLVVQEVLAHGPRE